jgi:hypothetical protein
MAAYPFTDSFDFTGEWFVSGQGSSALRIPGTLSWSSHRASLQLHDTFNAQRGAIYGDESYEYSAIHGVSTKSQLVSMLEALGVTRGWSFGQAGLREAQRLTSSWIVIGAHVDSETLYSSIRVRIPGLQIWLGRPGVEQTILHKTDAQAPGVIYRIDGLPEEINEIPSLPVTLGWGIDRNFSGDLITDISVKTSACLRITSETPQSLDWFLEQLGKVTTLLAFFAGSPMSANELTARIADTNAEVDVLVALRQADLCPHRSPQDFYMLRNDMEAGLGDIFSRWFELYDQVALPSQLALSVLSSDNLWPHVEFLSLMQALEGFHRALGGGLYASEEDYEQVKTLLIGAIPNTVTSDHREALKSRINYGNEISLRKRLNELVQRIEARLREQILGDGGVVPNNWVHTRNYYTHWDEASRDSVLSPIEMHRAHVRMRHLLRALYLGFVGIPQSSIARSLSNAYKDSQYLIQINNSEYRKKHPGARVTPLMHVEVKDAESPDPSSG